MLSILRHGVMVFVFYTEISNYFALVVSLVYCVFGLCLLKKHLAPPNWLVTLRYSATIMLFITFIVSLCVIIPFRPSMTAYMLVEGSSPFHHVLCPIFSVISFFSFERGQTLSKKSIFFALIPTIIYGVTLIILNLAKAIEGPYPFFYFYKVAWWFSLGGVLLVAFISIGTAILFRFFHNKLISPQNDTFLAKKQRIFHKKG